MGHWQQSEPVSLAPTGEGLPSADSVVRQRSLLHLRLRLRMDHSAILGGIRIPSAPLVQLAPRLSEVVPMLRPTRQIPDGRMGIPSICRNSATASGMAGTTLPCTRSNELSSERFLYRVDTTAAPALLLLPGEQPRQVGLQPSQLHVMAAE